MNLVTCCNPLKGPEDFKQQLRFPLLAALFFRRTYPEAKVYVGTTPDADIPAIYKRYFNVVRFDFMANPFALSRQMFYASFCRGEHFTDDTVFAGSDVIFGNKPFPELPEHKAMMTYRYHPAQPYCSDLVLVRKDHADFGAEFFDSLVKMIAFLPRKVRIFWADQIAMAIGVGKLQEDQFDGKMHQAPRYKEILLAPGDDFLYTPNDIFPSEKHRCTHRPLNDVQNTNQLLRLMYKKYAIHFKGGRKDWLFALAYMAYKRGWIDPHQHGSVMHDRELFKGAFIDQDDQAAA